MAFRGRKVFGSFEKRTPGSIRTGWYISATTIRLKQDGLKKKAIWIKANPTLGWISRWIVSNCLKKVNWTVKRCRTLLEQTRKRVRHTKKIIERAWMCAQGNFRLFRQKGACTTRYFFGKISSLKCFVFLSIIHELHPPTPSAAPHTPKRVLLWRNPSATARGFKQAKLTKTIVGTINENEASTFRSYSDHDTC